MFKKIVFLIFSFYGFSTAAQIKISGKVSYKDNTPLSNVIIYIDNAFYETQSDEKGNYSIEIDQFSDEGLTIIAYKKGYNEVSKYFKISEDIKKITCDIVFINLTNNLAEVVIDGSRNINSLVPFTSQKIKEMDIVINSSDVNIISALDNVSGAQQIGESGELSVRGGSGAETKYFFDGMILRNQLGTSIQGQGGGFRFSPTFFKSLEFNSGGYSAEYGQALSSVLLMESKDIPRGNTLGILVSPFFIDVETSWLLNKRESLEVKVNYLNFGVYSKIQQPKLPRFKLNKGPETFNANLFYKYRINEKSYFKIFSYTCDSQIISTSESIDNQEIKNKSEIKNINSYNLATLKYDFSSKTILNLGIAFAHNNDIVRTDTITNFFTTNGTKLEIRSNDFHSKGNIKLNVWKSLYLNSGLEFFNQKTLFKFGESYKIVVDNLIAAHLEGTFKIVNKLYTSIGIRTEYSSLTKKKNLSPRYNLTYKNDKKLNINISYGDYFQQTSAFNLLQEPSIDFLKASNLVILFEKKYLNQTFKIEMFNKNYDKLIRNQSAKLNVSGSGFARGIDVSGRGRNLFNKFNCSLFYSYLDAKRLYIDYPVEANVSFASKHKTSIVVNSDFFGGKVIMGVVYKYASGRPYFNPNKSDSEYNSDRTNAFHSLNTNIIYSVKIKKIPFLFITTITNALGNAQTFGYEYSTTDFLKRRPMQPLYNRFIFVGCYITLGLDKSDDFIDSLLNN